MTNWRALMTADPLLDVHAQYPQNPPNRSSEPTLAPTAQDPKAEGQAVLTQAERIASGEWPTLTEAERQGFLGAVRARRMRERGETPPHYTATTVCDGCGQVPIFPGAGKQVKGCPWCFNRISGLPVPRATRDC